MKIKTRKSSWDEILTKGPIPHRKPKKPPLLFRALVRLLSIPDLWKVRFSYEKVGMERAGEGPYLILMNHSSFLDLKIASKILFPMPYNIVSTTDAFVGKKWLMTNIGCMPTQKFVTDVNLVLDMTRVIKKEKRSILMYPEAGYSFDGTATLLPERIGGMLKRFGVPLLMIRTDAGGFLRDPLYNGLRLRKTRVKATLTCLLSRDEIREKSQEELDEVIRTAFSFDHFREQKEKKIPITEPFRATGLERVLYRCPACGKEGRMKGEGETLSCLACGKEYHMDHYGSLAATNGETEFSHIPDWFAWQRAQVKQEVEEGTCGVEVPVRVMAICDQKAMYDVGDGFLSHSRKGFVLYREDKTPVYTQDPWFSYSLNADFFFYEIGDMISIGNKERLYYLFPKEPIPVTRMRLATEEIYRLPKE